LDVVAPGTRRIAAPTRQRMIGCGNDAADPDALEPATSTSSGPQIPIVAVRSSTICVTAVLCHRN
jgi:hypothetical protein